MLRAHGELLVVSEAIFVLDVQLLFDYYPHEYRYQSFEDVF